MIGNIKQDISIIDRQPQGGIGNPSSLPFTNPHWAKDNNKLPQVTTRKLNALYNTANMPVRYTAGGSTIPSPKKLGGGRNDSIARILFPKRMPYKVTP